MWDLQRLWYEPQILGPIEPVGHEPPMYAARPWPAFTVQTNIMKAATKLDGWRLPPMSQDSQLWFGWQLVEYFECFAAVEIKPVQDNSTLGELLHCTMLIKQRALIPDLGLAH